MLENLKPVLTSFAESHNNLRHFSLRIQWIFRTKSKLLFCRAASVAQHKLLRTLLGLIILQSTREKSSQNLLYASAAQVAGLCRNLTLCCSILNSSLAHSISSANRAIYGDD